MSNTANRDPRPESSTGKATSWLPFKIGYLLAILACLIQWRQRSPWLRIDIFSGAYLLMRALPVLREIFRRVSAPVSAEFRRERWGCSAAPGWINWVLVLMAVDLTVYLDYGHWHFVPALQQPIMQAVGLLLHVAAALWKRWTDRYLAAAFTNRAQPALVQSGPFRFIRHPYYAAALLDKLAVALIFASIAGWLLFIPWCVLLLRQVRLEESHMRTIFGDRYERYSRQTARLLPGVY